MCGRELGWCSQFNSCASDWTVWGSNPVRGKDCYILQSAQAGPRAYLVSCSVGTMVLSRGSSGLGVKTNHHLLVPRLMMSDTIPLLPISLYGVNRKHFAFCIWCVVFHFVDFWCRWEEEKKEDGTKWNFLEHKGPVFAPPYERLPPDIKFFYDGLCFLHYSSTTFRLPCYCIIKHNWHAGCMLMYNVKFWENFLSFYSPSDVVYVVRLVGYI